jgi:hypothetical protein
MTLVGAQGNPGTQQQARDSGGQARRQHDRIAEGTRAQEHGGCTLVRGLDRPGTQTVHVSGLEKPSFHGDAG